MKTLKYTFAILFMTTFLIACEAEDVATDDAVIENFNAGELDGGEGVGGELDGGEGVG